MVASPFATSVTEGPLSASISAWLGAAAFLAPFLAGFFVEEAFLAGFFLVEEDRWVTLKLTADAIRTINKNGLYNVVKELRAKGQEI